MPRAGPRRRARRRGPSGRARRRGRRASVAERVQRPHERLAVGHASSEEPRTAARRSASSRAGHDGVRRGDADVAPGPRATIARRSSPACRRSRCSASGMPSTSTASGALGSRSGTGSSPGWAGRWRSIGVGEGVDMGASLGEETRRGAKSRGAAPSIATPSVTTCAAVTAPRPARRALITGLTGQDGLYLAEELLAEGTEVVGLVRPGSDAPLPAERGRRPAARGRPARPRRAAAGRGRGGARRALPPGGADVRPRLLGRPDRDRGGHRGRDLGRCSRPPSRQAPRPRVWVAGSAEVFGDSGEHPQNERSPMRPRTPYGVAKLAAHGLVGTLRAHHGLFACSGLTFNHESPRRPARFLPRKVTRAAAAIRLGLEDHVVLGDLDAVRDWSHAQDVVRGGRAGAPPRRAPATTSSPRAAAARSASSSRSPSPTRASTPRRTSASTRR